MTRSVTELGHNIIITPTAGGFAFEIEGFQIELNGVERTESEAIKEARSLLWYQIAIENRARIAAEQVAEAAVEATATAGNQSELEKCTNVIRIWNKPNANRRVHTTVERPRQLSFADQMFA